MRVIVHIGTPKTGSTFLQHFFLENRKIFLENNIFFPTTGLAPINQYRGGRFACHNRLLKAIATQDELGIDAFRREIEQAGAQNVIISSENFSIYPDAIEFIASLLHPFDVKIIVYLRRQDFFLESLYKEFINGGWLKLTEDVEKFFFDYEGPYGIIPRNYNKLIAPWAQAFGTENILVRPFEKRQFFEQDLIRDFFHAVKLPWNNDYTYPEETAKNISPGVQVNKILRDLNRIPLQQTYYQEALNIIFSEHQEPSSGKGKKQFFSSPQLRYNILKKYEESNKQVARTYLARSTGRLFYAPEPDPDGQFTPIRTTNIDLVSKLYSIFLMQFGNELNDQLANSSEELNRHKGELNKHEEELSKHEEELSKQVGELRNQAGKLSKQAGELRKYAGELSKYGERIKLLEQFANRTEQTQKLATEEIKSLKKEILTVRRLSRKNSLAIWINGRNRISRRIKNFLHREIPLIKNSGLFDSQWYLQQYPEVAKFNMNPIRHYVKKGVELGYNPSPNFDTKLYIQNNMAVMLSGLNPLTSYILKLNKTNKVS